MPANASTVAAVVFGRDGGVGVAGTDVSTMPAFKGAAGRPNAGGTSENGAGTRMQPRPASFVNGAGVQTVEASYHAASHYDGGPKGRRTVPERAVSEKGIFPTKVMQGPLVVTATPSAALQHGSLW